MSTLAKPLPAATLRLERKHPLALRWMHWINFPVLFIMIWSGLLIYWNDSDNAYRHAHRVYRVGLGSLHPLSASFRIGSTTCSTSPFRVTEGLGFHFFFMWIFALERPRLRVLYFRLFRRVALSSAPKT